MNGTEKENAALPIEAQMEKIEELIRRLESNELSMEESFSVYAEGLSLISSCKGSIDEVEKKVLVLTESGETHEL